MKTPKPSHHLGIKGCIHLSAYVCWCTTNKRLDGLLYHSLPHYFQTGSLTEPGARLSASTPLHPSVELQMYMAMLGFSCRCWGFKFRSLCLHSKCVYLQNHHPRPNDFLKISFIGKWSMCLCRGQRTICESWPSPTRWIPEIKLRQLVWNNCLYPLYQPKSKVLVNF